MGPRTPVGIDDRRRRFPDAARVEVTLEQASQELRTLRLEQPLDVGVGHPPRLLAVEAGDETFKMFAGGKEGIGVGNGVCLHACGASGVVYGLRNRIRTSPCPTSSTLQAQSRGITPSGRRPGRSAPN